MIRQIIYKKTPPGKICFWVFLTFLVLKVGAANSDPINILIDDSVNGNQLELSSGDTIFDPFKGKIGFAINVNSLFWGSTIEDTTLVQFSLDGSYIWTNADTIWARFATQYAVLSDEIRLDQAVNVLQVLAKVPNPDNNEDTLFYQKDFTIYYTKPKIEIVEAAEFEQPDSITTISSDSLAVKLNARSQFPSNNQWSYIKRIQGRYQEKSFIDLYTAPANGLPVIELEIENILDTLGEELVPGWNSLSFRSEGRCNPAPSGNNCTNGEFSEVITLHVFYLTHAPPPNNGVFSLENKHYLLEGIPPGGEFEGDGITGSVFFNPSLAGPGEHTITYSYPLTNIDDPVVSIPLTVLEGQAEDPPIAGPQEVCRKAVEYYDYDGDAEIIVEGGMIVQIEPEEGFWVEWTGEGAEDNEYARQTGRILIGDNEFLVDITQANKPDKPSIQLINNNLLICSDSNALYYRWMKNEDPLHEGFLTSPYFFLDGVALNTGDKLYVEIRNTLGAFDCFSQSDPIEVNATASYLTKETDVSMHLYPNPCYGELTVSFDGETDIYRVELIDFYGRIRYVMTLSREINQPIIHFPCGQFEKGLYVVRAVGAQRNYYQKIFIGK